MLGRRGTTEVGWWGKGLSGRETPVAQCDVCYCGFQIEDMEISLPNIHYFNIDMSKMGLINKDEVRTLKTFIAHLPSLYPSL